MIKVKVENKLCNKHKQAKGKQVLHYPQRGMSHSSQSPDFEGRTRLIGGTAKLMTLTDTLSKHDKAFAFGIPVSGGRVWEWSFVGLFVSFTQVSRSHRHEDHFLHCRQSGLSVRLRGNG